MKAIRGSLLASGLIASNAVHATTPKYCPTGADNVCFRFGIPQSSADSGSGNIYFQIRAPSTYSWVALGTGDQMKGANIFVMYQDGSGNLTLSPRLGTGHSEPKEDTSSSAAKLGLLAGSGVVNGVMTANVVCPNCESWNGGSLSLTDTASKWIAAWKSGSSLATTSKSASISQHDDHDQFQLDLTQATVSSDSNPFLEADTEDPGSGSGGGSTGGGGGGSDDPGVVAGPGNPFAPGVGRTRRNAALVAHSVIMTATFAALYPLGAMLMPLTGSWIAHAIWQTVAFVMMWVGFGIGMRVAQDRNMLFNNTHTKLGTAVVFLLLIQPVLGVMHHKYFLKYRERGVVSYAHIWWGRILLTTAIVNGGLGLKLSNANNSAVVAYSIIAAVCFGIYAIVKSWAVVRRGRQQGPHLRKSDNFTHQQRYPVGRQPYRPRNRV
ncbi:hypothetical protein B0H65DRAFT_29679 [Neurospora tetraspora]|uniref:DOMON domain-containing protein n=1 Tax=Neurospora tetraspora TaxID=94610 RepID=A0AAE0JP59_9PEZI|nr:hypothetical protein B0H65DRAFT_29679 [Neurospora tetraspora]